MNHYKEMTDRINNALRYGHCGWPDNIPNKTFVTCDTASTKGCSKFTVWKFNETIEHYKSIVIDNRPENKIKIFLNKVKKWNN